MTLKKLAFNGIKATAVAALVGGSALIATTASGCAEKTQGACCEKKCGADHKCGGEKKCGGEMKCGGEKQCGGQK